MYLNHIQKAEVFKILLIRMCQFLYPFNQLIVRIIDSWSPSLNVSKNTILLTVTTRGVRLHLDITKLRGLTQANLFQCFIFKEKIHYKLEGIIFTFLNSMSL